MQSKEYFIVEPAAFKLDGGAMFGIIPKPLWNKVHPADEDNRIELALRLMLIKIGDKNILIDTGIGDYHGDKFNQRFGVTKIDSPLEMALSKINLSSNDITDVIISHLHFDHVGGLIKIIDQKPECLFPKATIHLHRDHYNYSLNPTDRDTGSFHRETFGPLIKKLNDEKRIHWLEGMEGNILGDIKFKCSMGHTPFLIHPYDDKFIYLADLIPTSNHVAIPWVMGYDIAPGTTTEDKKKILPFIQDKNLTIIFEHDPIFYGAKLSREGLSQISEKLKAQNELAYGISLI